MDIHKVYDCVIIGAGPGGIVATKELLEKGIDNVVCLEQSHQLGGTFANSYDSLTLTSSATFSMFSDFLNKPGEGHNFWSRTEAVAYWTRYAEHCQVLPKIQFNKRVKSIVDDGEGWHIALDDGMILWSERIVVATGNNNFENYPAWKEALTDVEYLHSKHYRNAEAFRGKRVLVVGGGESASDMALELSRVAESCWISLRDSAGWVVPRKRGGFASDVSTHRGLWGAPRRFGTYVSQRSITNDLAKNDPVNDAVAMLNRRIKDPRGIWSTYGTKTVAMAEAIAYHSCQLVEEITSVEAGGRTLTTKTGQVLEEVDAVVFSTGYMNLSPFLPEVLCKTDPRALYKHMLHPDLGTRIAWVGVARPGFGSQFPIMEMQARYFALLCAGRLPLPDRATMNEVIARDLAKNLEQFGHNGRRIRSLVDYMHYMDELAELIGCQPPLIRYLLTKPWLWMRLMYGPSQATQYRLTGPDAKRELAEYILSELPVSRLNYVVKTGIKVRLMQFFEFFVPRLKSQQPRLKSQQL
jgi:dimethylaniline monooxygenase (N-oxide forming)